jgi:dienelactone hydrolase
LIIAHDIFGLDGGRTKVVCDELSKNNLSIYMPDFFRTEWFDPYDKTKSQEDLGNFIRKFPPENL